MNTPIILASSSSARRMLLGRLCSEFRCISPDIDETPRPGEPPEQLARRLARQKAARVASSEGTAAIIIASDQVASTDHETLDKPGTPTANIELLCRLSGDSVRFHTAVYVIPPNDGQHREYVDETIVEFRTLTRPEIEAYVRHDEPWQCAGGFKAESAGIGLFRRIRSEDPTGLIGLPLIQLAAVLRDLGVDTLPGAVTPASAN